MAQLPDFLGGFNQQAQINQQADTAHIQQAGALQGILKEAQGQERAHAFRTEIAQLGPNATADQITQVASKYADPKELLAHGDRVTGQANVKEMALARLQQAAQQGAQTFALRAQGAKTAQEQKQIENDYKAFQASVARERLQYDTGATVAPFAPLSYSGVPAAPPNATIPPPGTPAPLSGQAPDQAAAVAAINANRAAGGPGGTLEIPSGSPQPPVAAPAAPAGADPWAMKPAPVVAPSAPAAPNNLDARDLRLQNAAPQGALAGILAQSAPPVSQPPATPAAVAAPKQPGQFTPADAPAGMIAGRDRARWAEQQNKAPISGAASIPPATATFIAKQYLNGNSQAALGWARNATAKTIISNAIVDEAGKQGLSPEAVNAKIAEFAGTMAGSRTIGQRAANISLAATETQEMIPIVKETSDKFARTNFVPWNMALKAYESGTGSPEIAAFGASVNALVNVYARAINPTGVPTVSDKKHARAVINTIQSPDQVDAVLGIISRELDIAKRAPGTVQRATSERVRGGSVRTRADDFFR